MKNKNVLYVLIAMVVLIVGLFFAINMTKPSVNTIQQPAMNDQNMPGMKH